MRNMFRSHVVTLCLVLVFAATSQASLPAWLSSFDVEPVVPGGPGLTIDATLAGMWSNSARPDRIRHTLQATPTRLNIFVDVLAPDVPSAQIPTPWVLQDTIGPVTMPYAVYGQLWSYPANLPQFAVPAELEPTLLFLSPLPEPTTALLLAPALLILRRRR